LSRNTQHALIALCSIGTSTQARFVLALLLIDIAATIILFLVGWLIYHMKLSVCSSEICIFHRRDRYKSIKEVTPPLGRWSVAGSEWRRERRTRSVTLDHASQIPTAEAVLRAPAPVLTRPVSQPTSHTSHQLRTPVITPPTSSHQPPKQEDVQLELDIAQRTSLTPSSPVLRLVQRPRSSYWSRSHSSSSRSSLPFYLKGVERPPQLPLVTSHFSWTDSQVTHTPTTSQTHHSISTSRSSTPRFRTIDSWVGNQAARVNPD
jgi:hypothetical protein